MCSFKIQTENFRENTNAPPALPIGNASALRASRGVHNNAMLGFIFVTYTDICEPIMFTVQANHQGTSTRFHFHVRLKPMCRTNSIRAGLITNLITESNMKLI